MASCDKASGTNKRDKIGDSDAGPAPSPSHRDSRGDECGCAIGKDHHKNSKNEDCMCLIQMDHSTQQSPHADRGGRRCPGTLVPEHFVAGMRACRACGREEVYAPGEYMVVFAEGVSDVAATDFLFTFRFGGAALVISISSQRQRNMIQHGNTIAIRVTFSAASERSPDEWIEELERSECVRFVSRMPAVRYSDV